MKPITLEELFSNKVFKIPDYQRGYSWEPEQIKDLIDDLELTTNRKHFTGTIVWKNTNEQVQGFGENYRKCEIVDGQQRITSLIIFLNEIIKELQKIINSDESRKTAENLTEAYIKKEGKQGSIYKLELDEGNNVYFRDKILGSDSAEAKTKAHFLLEKAKTTFREYLVQKRNLEKEYHNFLQELITKITTLLGFTVYEVEDDSEVGVIFEVLNDRGKPLTKLDIVKNFLIYEIDKISVDKEAKRQLTERINYGWKQILENLATAGWMDAEDENQFLRINFVLNFYSKLSKRKEGDRTISVSSQLADVHKLVKNHFKDLEKQDRDKCYWELEAYINSLTRMSTKFRDLLKPFEENAFQEVSDDKKQDIESVASRFSMLKIQSSVLPVLVAVYEVYSNDAEKLLRLMKLCEMAVFRIYYIAGDRSFAGLDKFRRLANQIYRNRLPYETIVREMKTTMNKYCPNEDIEKKLSDKEDFYEWNGLKYFLYELERKRCKESAVDKKTHFEWDQMKGWKLEDTIEHILPQKIVEDDGRKVLYWTERFDEKSHKKNHKRLGNMTLSYSNSKGGNKGYDEKKTIFRDSKWQITMDVAEEHKDWNENAIIKRESMMIDFAKRRWGDASIY